MSEKNSHIQKGMMVMNLIGLFFAALDTITKYYVARYISVKPIMVTPWFSFLYAENKGIAWSLPVIPLVVITISLALIFALQYYAAAHCHIEKTVTQLAFGLLIGGAIGNLIDRIARGFVIDFISFSFWPVFNLADTFIVVGVFLIILFYGRIKRSEKKVS